MSTVEQLPATVDLHFTRGDRLSFRLFFFTLDDDGVTQIPEDIGDWALEAQWANSYAATATKVDLDVELVTDGSDGLVDVLFTAVVSSDLGRVGVWDLERTEAGSERTVAGGDVQIDPDVTVPA